MAVCVISLSYWRRGNFNFLLQTRQHLNWTWDSNPHTLKMRKTPKIHFPSLDNNYNYYDFTNTTNDIISQTNLTDFKNEFNSLYYNCCRFPMVVHWKEYLITIIFSYYIS